MIDFDKWTCIFPGKMGLSWKDAWYKTGTKEEAELEANKYANTIAVPVQLFEKMKEHERRMVVAEREINEIRVQLENWKCGYTTIKDHVVALEDIRLRVVAAYDKCEDIRTGKIK